ncbi:MAG: Tetratricopeptide repeat protein [Candidatus Latescibacteria bacterium ADurb.Bin168]|nr:MAG: Tetratricopeptide repeat protein [Candidatus Latescibacteria bacterium ADurb.Bin168]
MAKSRIETFKAFLEKDPGNSLARYSLAMEFRKAGRYDDALARFAELIERDPKYVPAYFMCGQTAVEAGKVEEAKKVLRVGIDVARNAGETHAAEKMAELLATLE